MDTSNIQRRYYTDVLQTLSRNYIDDSSTFYRYFTDISPPSRSAANVFPCRFAANVGYFNFKTISETNYCTYEMRQKHFDEDERQFLKDKVRH